YVDNASGSDSNTGSSPDQAVKSPDRAFQLAGDNIKIEFHRGQTFDIDQPLNINGHDLYVGAYGNGADPVLRRKPGYGSVTLFEQTNAQDVTIQHITFDSVYTPVNGIAPKMPATAVWVRGT